MLRSIPDPIYSTAEWQAWQQLRDRFHEGQDLWTERELDHLRFLRWLAGSGRLSEDGGPRKGGAEPPADEQLA